LPILVVLATVAAWYVGDAFYNDYAGHYTKVFEPSTLQTAWWEVACFLFVFLLATPAMHRQLNSRFIHRGSGVQKLIAHGITDPKFQQRIGQIFYGCLWIWAALVLIAFIRLRGEILYYFFPFLAYKAEPWGRGRIGAGFDALLTVAFYLQLFVTAIFGLVAALSVRRRTILLAVLCCVLSWPYFLFDRTRNTTLAVVMPAVLSLAFLRLRGGTIKKLAVLAACFVFINAWMAFIISNRSTSSIVGAFREKGFSLASDERVHHEGLNMYEELCWLTTFINQGTYHPSWGGRYFADVVNPIPRSLWPGKPMIGINYAIARGQASGTQGDAGVFATISTGLIGQGVDNFGFILGPAFAALLMSLWVAVLARLDLRVEKMGRLPLYGLGLILTFNLGRDITLITLYPFVFGAALIWFLARLKGRSIPRAVTPITKGLKPQHRDVNKPPAKSTRRFFFARRHGQLRASLGSMAGGNVVPRPQARLWPDDRIKRQPGTS
jgi:hypothetical protein